MSEEIKQKVIQRLTIHENKIIIDYIYRAAFFMVAALFTIFVFEDFIVSAAAKPEYATWFNTQIQSQVTLLSHFICASFIVLSFASVSVVLIKFFDESVRVIYRRIKNKSGHTLS